MLGSLRKYGTGIGMWSRLGYAGGTAKAFTRDTVADNHPGYPSSIGARMTGAEMIAS